MLSKNLFIIISIFKNLLLRNKIFFVIDGYKWVVHEIGKEKKKYIGNKFIVTSSSRFIKKSIIHFGTLNAFLVSNKKNFINSSNKIVVTIHHLPDTKKNLQEIYVNKKNVDYWIVSTLDIKYKIEKFINSQKIEHINICVEDSYFKFNEIKKDFQPTNVVFGSFVKDGNSNNNDPKFVKGPDILFEIISKINKKINLSVILTGPNREWIKKKFKQNQIVYQHFNFNYFETIKLYKKIDFLIVTSRIEGGPRWVMEAVNSKVPVISSNVGIIKDYFTNKVNFILVDENNLEKSVEDILNIIKNKNLRNSIINSANVLRINFSLEKKINRYQDIYSKLQITNPVKLISMYFQNIQFSRYLIPAFF